MLYLLLLHVIEKSNPSKFMLLKPRPSQIDDKQLQMTSAHQLIDHFGADR
jgi:hypothetical protein